MLVPRFGNWGGHGPPAPLFLRLWVYTHVHWAIISPVCKAAEVEGEPRRRTGAVSQRSDSLPMAEQSRRTAP